MHQLAADIRYAYRGLIRTKGLTLVAIFSIGLALGANTTVFSLVNAILFRPLDFPNAEQLVDLSETSETKLCAGCGVGTSWPTFSDWRTRAHSFTEIAAYGEQQFLLTGDGEAERVRGGVAGANLFSVLGIAPVLGRGFHPEEDRIGGPPVVILGDGIWQRRFGGDPRILGRAVTIDGIARTVIGVMPPGFKYPEFADLWVPIVPHVSLTNRNDRSIGVVGRLKETVTLEAAAAEMRGIGQQLEQAYPEAQAEWVSEVTPIHDDFSSGTGEPFLLLMGAVGFVLLIACANLAALFLARMTGRRREMAVRAALGATRGQLIRIVVLESLIVSVTGGVLGVAIAYWGVSIAIRGISEPIPYWIRFGVDWRVLCFAFAASVISGLGFGIIPALRASRPDVTGDLKDGTPGSGATRNRLGHILVVVELGLAMMLLTGAGLHIRTFLRVTRPAAGFDAEHVLQADLPLVGERFADPALVGSAAAAILQQLERLPDATVGLSRTEFIAGFGGEERQISVQGVLYLPAGASPRFGYYVSPDYLAIQDRTIVEGRGITPADRAGREGVVVVNQAFAGRVFPGASPLGRQLKLGPRDSDRPWLTIVGVVADPTPSATGGGVASEAWGALAQSPGSAVTLQLSLKTQRDPLLLEQLVRDQLREAAPDVPVERLQTAATALGRQFWHVRFFAMVFGVFAAIALLLAAIGTHGLLAHLVGQRTREIGVRLALGADSARVTRMVLGQGAALGTIGIGAGLAGSWALSRLMQSILYGTSPLDPLVIASVVPVFASATFGASLIPAQRAARVQPVEALRAE